MRSSKKRHTPTGASARNNLRLAPATICRLTARLDQKLTYDELSEKSGVSSRYIKEIENHGNVPSLEKLGQLIRALHISADPFFYPAAPTDNLDYQRLLVYLSECTNDQITTILALVEAYLRTYKTHETE